ncbi:BAG family molecular chaperone regulator 4-like [Coffea arabica]|uniref:BAG family molecular chaperone regulator 4-like n=1 Tax=Coffea arabica TaxID=13443 RepID=A0A6P6SRN2_COFAR
MMVGSNERGEGSNSVQRRDDEGQALMVKVSHGSTLVDISVPSNSTFGDLKRVIAQETGLEPQLQKLFFRGKEKEDGDLLQMAGIKDNSKLVLMEDAGDKQMNPQEINEPSEVSRGGAAVFEVRAEVDKLSEQVSALQAVVHTGNKVDERNIVYLTEMLMRQLLKLDSIEAEGEGKIQRKLEVCRVQSLVETMDTLRARNSNPFSDCTNAVSVTTNWETFDAGVADPNAPTPVPCSIKVTQEWEQFD